MLNLGETYEELLRRGMPEHPNLWCNEAGAWYRYVPGTAQPDVAKRVTDSAVRAELTQHALAWVRTVEHKTLGGLNVNSLEWVLAVTKGLQG